MSYSVPKLTIAAQPRVSIHFYKAQTPAEVKIRQLLLNTAEIRDFASFINQYFQLRYSIQLRFGALDGPLFDLKRRSIDVPYRFMSEMIKIFQSARYGRTGLSPTQAATDTLIYVLFHEWGHALLDMYALPIQADKEEDIADHFATTMLLKHFEGGAEIAMSTADMFDIASRYYARDKENYYWDEHSLDIVRSRNLLCHVYGSDPKRYQHLAQHHSHLRQRSKDCVHRYQHLLKTWGIQLAPYVTPTIQATKQSRTAKSTAAPKRKPSVVIKPKFLNYTPR